jgi:hypothetical protein
MAAKDIAVRNAVLAERIHQRAGDVVLAYHVGEALWTVLPGQNLITHCWTRSRGPPEIPAA